METVNLIPAARRDAKRRRKHHKTCVAACGAYALLLACAVGGAHLLWIGNQGALDDKLAATEDDIARLQHQTAELRSELSASHATIEANRTVAEQPDWSVLLALLARTIGDDVVLRSVSIAPPPTAVVAAPVAGAKSAAPDVVLELIGMGRSPLAVSQHVLRLEETGLFSKVMLLDTGREPLLSSQVIAFRLRCIFGEPRLPEPQAVSPEVTAVDAGGVGQ